MKIEFELKIDERTQDPYWSAMVKHNDQVLMQIVSQTFKGVDDKQFVERYENTTVRVMKEIFKMKKGERNTTKFLLNHN